MGVLGTHGQVLVGNGRVIDLRHQGRRHMLQPFEAVKRRVRLKRNEAYRRVELTEPATDADKGAARAESSDEMRQPPARLLDDLGSGRIEVRPPVAVVAVLIGIKVPVRIGRYHSPNFSNRT